MKEIPDLPNLEGWFKTNGVNLGILILVTALLALIIGIFIFQKFIALGLVLLGVGFFTLAFGGIVRIE